MSRNNLIHLEIMRQLFCNNVPLQIFFNEDHSIERIACWVSFCLLESENIFNLNDKCSCSIQKAQGNTIHIGGDEDFVILTLIDIYPVNIPDYI